MLQPFVLGIVCQPQSDNVPSGVVCSNAPGKVCNPVASTVKANVAVADGQRIVRVELAQHHVVPGHERVPVNPIRRSLGRSGADYGDGNQGCDGNEPR